MGANRNSTPPAKALAKTIHFPPHRMEDTDAERWLDSHDRLVKAAHALDRALMLCQINDWAITFDSPIMREFRAAVASVKEIEDRHRALAGVQ